MSKLHAQMALLGTIDEVARRTTNPETIATIEKFLPGTTGVGQQGWYRELKHFLNTEELRPRDENGIAIPNSEPVTFPDLEQALIEVSTEPLAENDPASPGVVSRSIFASMVLGIVDRIEPGGLAEVLNMPDFDMDPLSTTLSAFNFERSEASSEEIPGLDERDRELPQAESLRNTLLRVRSRDEYLDLTRGFARSNEIDPFLRDAMKRPALCTGSLRRIDGQFCTVLTTDWPTDFTLSQVRGVIHPENWPHLCTFFASMDKQDPFDPDVSRGWTRLLEGVSGDPTQWKMVTALRFWMAEPDSGGIYLNYDLDCPRVGDRKLVEVDAGYIRVIPVDGNPDPKVKIRTSKQVRIRGVSSTATAALACGFGWGDAMSDMFEEGVTGPAPVAPGGRVPLTPSVDPGPPSPEDVEEVNAAALQQDGNRVGPDAAILAAVKEVELIRGWRGAIIEAMRTQLGKGIDTARDLGTDFAVRWSDGDGLSLDDVQQFGGRAGTDITAFATGVFKKAAAALQPKYDDVDAGGGND
ncbi:MAG TPA: hypothetical protein VJR50_12775 [Mycobacterium sp.]|nr:hypothetical protein [Mycobacterium sp.]